ncbi:MAG TPA: cytochrome d ubiquinol oxidase subunit II [Longimicrobiales bacterium]|nr:cytochrome d ubiquinol oxidase subunit II [Longimicrobiales bacterium]
MLELGVAALTLLAVIAYAVLGGADFGGGIWDAAAAGPRKLEQRDAIARAMGPVWEANHVWLIFVIVLLFSSFPSAYSALSVALFLPFHLVLLGIILRGAAFVFRAYSPESGRSLGPSRQARRWGALFGAASVITPFLLGMCLGAVSAGGIRIAPGRVSLEGLPWLAPVSLAMGAFALAMCAYLAAVFLAYETAGELREDFRARALWAGTAVVGLSVLLLPLLAVEARHLWEGLLRPRTLPVIGLGVVAALASGWFLRSRRYRLARFASILQVACLVAGWGLAQFPYLIYPDLTLHDAAAPEPMLRFVLFTLPLGLALLLPSLWLLFRVFKGKVV